LDRRSAGHTLESAALANEAYLKLIRAGGVRCESRVHFLALCSQIIRRILVDHARNRKFAKRGGGAVQIPLDEGVAATKARQVEVLALDEALASLFKLDPRKGRLVELRRGGPGNFAGDCQARLENGEGVVVSRADRDARSHHCDCAETLALYSLNAPRAA
jgi:RNA polymerase sigma factor (TIGR02999 family)